ncbi:MAG: phosphoribosylformylglycinamidine synthase I [Candidatus Heimdallarchaeota archaeon]|nr:phosphoribosylformylglycinamidine synthase I [Candidatus Heimdallarchaeota archaeon]MDH5644527.1 phosphoribosylformylglycinamidine synthase I [Candidatus Heimdallarchaeota archaeon]
MKIAIIRFPGTNNEHELIRYVNTYSKHEPILITNNNYHQLDNMDRIIIAGGFSYGDYLRPGIIAAKSPIGKKIKELSLSSIPILGICNGFQILCETGILPGVLTKNLSTRFISKMINLKVQSKSPYFINSDQNNTLQLPIAHYEGNYYCSHETLLELKKKGQIAFQYSSPTGQISDEYNPNGSINSIAGIYNADKTVLGLMPHPERASDPLLGSSDGRIIIDTFLGDFHVN